MIFGEMGLREGNEAKLVPHGPKCAARSTPVYPEGTSASVEARLCSVQRAARSPSGVHVESSVFSSSVCSTVTQEKIGGIDSGCVNMQEGSGLAPAETMRGSSLPDLGMVL